MNPRQLLSLVMSIVVLCAAIALLHAPVNANSIDALPPFTPSIPVMGFLLLLFPAVCLPLFVILALLVLRNPPGPYTSLIFLGLGFAATTIDLTNWTCGMRLITFLLVAATAMAIEIYVRKLPAVFTKCILLSYAITITFYFSLIGINSSASV